MAVLVAVVAWPWPKCLVSIRSGISAGESLRTLVAIAANPSNVAIAVEVCDRVTVGFFATSAESMPSGRRKSDRYVDKHIAARDGQKLNCRQ